jgi:DNA-binding CsgD family transcriptional regulator
MASDAVTLFAQRAAAVRTGFVLDHRNVRDVATICRLLDGLPLAIELAAARTSILSPQVMAQRLQRRLPLLADGPRNVPDRLRTMRNAIAWSYDLLTPKEQAVFRRLSIYAGPWSLGDAVATVADPGSTERGDEFATLDLISSLVDKSLVRQVDTGGSSPVFGMLFTLREFGLEQLEASGELEALEERHARAMITLGETAAPELTGPNQVEWLERLGSRLPDIEAAFAWAIEHDPPDLALRLAASMWRYSYTRGPTRAGREWIVQALARYPDRTTLRATGLHGLGILAGIEWDFEAAREAHAEALEIALEIGDRRSAGLAYMGLGDSAATDVDSELALRHYEAARAIFVKLGDRRNIAVATTNMANLMWNQRQLGPAIEGHERARLLYTAAGDQRGIAWSATNIGRIAAQMHNYERAVPSLVEAIDAYEQIGDRGGIAESLEGSAQVAFGRGEPLRACALLAAADSLREAVHHPISPVDRAEYDAILVEVRTALGATFQPTWDANQHLPLQQVRALIAGIMTDSPPADVADVALPVTNDAEKRIRELGLTEREIEVLTLIAAGKTDKDIAEELFIGVRTVQSHVANLLAKLDVNARSAAVARALRSGIIT